MAKLSRYPIFVIFLLAPPSVIHFAPAEALGQCLYGVQLQAPITEAPFDCFFEGQPSRDPDPLMGPILGPNGLKT